MIAVIADNLTVKLADDKSRLTDAGRNRRSGGGRKTLTATNPTLLEDLLALVSPSKRGNPSLMFRDRKCHFATSLDNGCGAAEALSDS